VIVVVLHDLFRVMEREETPRRPNSRATPQGLDQKSKMEVVPRWRAEGSQLPDNLGGELDPTTDNRRGAQEEFSFCFILYS